MSQSRRKNKRPMSQPPPAANLEEDSPPLSRVRRELHDTDSERTISPEPSNTNTSTPRSGRASPPVSRTNVTRGGPPSGLEPNDKRVLIRVIGPETFHPIKVHRQIFPSMTKIFPKASETFNKAPQQMKDMWFNEFKKLYKWEPNDEPLVREAFEKRASRRFSNQLGDA